MFNTLGSFSAVYFALAAILFVLILFEKYFIRLEENIKAKKKATKKPVKSNICKKSARKSQAAPKLKTNNVRTATVRRIPNNAA